MGVWWMGYREAFTTIDTVLPMVVLARQYDE